MASAVSRLQDEVAELQARVDYAEHRLAKPDSSRQLPP